jgi:copper oxidase (laccase) domain-containing protein
VPILFFEPKTRTVGAVHCGREGTRRNAIGAAINLAVQKMGCAASDIRALIGAAICGLHYPVDEASFTQFVQDTQVSQNFPCLDLTKTVHHQLLCCGVLPQHIENQNICTWEDERYFSYRRNGDKNRQVFLIGIIHE